MGDPRRRLIDNDKQALVERLGRSLSPARLGKEMPARTSSRHFWENRRGRAKWTAQFSGKLVSSLLPGRAGERHIFWTGGYDSTWRILQALLVDKHVVLPIYLGGTIDNFDGKLKRRSANFELSAMQSIRDEVERSFPSASARLQQLVVVEDVFPGKEVADAMNKLKANDMVRRSRCQYGACAQLTCTIRTPVDVSVVEGDFLWHSLLPHLECQDDEWLVSDEALEQMPELSIFRWLRFPLVKYSKESMLEEATRMGFDHLLQKTWTCWYPLQNGDPCGRCDMCKHRIL